MARKLGGVKMPARPSVCSVFLLFVNAPSHSSCYYALAGDTLKTENTIKDRSLDYTALYLHRNTHYEKLNIHTIYMHSAILLFFLSSVLVSSPKLCTGFSLKGGDPAAPSGTATLLRLSPSHRFRLRRYRYRLRAPSAPMA